MDPDPDHGGPKTCGSCGSGYGSGSGSPTLSLSLASSYSSSLSIRFTSFYLHFLPYYPFPIFNFYPNSFPKTRLYFSSFPSISVSLLSLFLPHLRLLDSNPHFPSSFLLFSALSRVPDLIFPSPGGKIDVPGLIWPARSAIHALSAGPPPRKWAFVSLSSRE